MSHPLKVDSSECKPEIKTKDNEEHKTKILKEAQKEIQNLNDKYGKILTSPAVKKLSAGAEGEKSSKGYSSDNSVLAEKNLREIIKFKPKFNSIKSFKSRENKNNNSNSNSSKNSSTEKFPSASTVTAASNSSIIGSLNLDKMSHNQFILPDSLYPDSKDSLDFGINSSTIDAEINKITLDEKEKDALAKSRMINHVSLLKGLRDKAIRYSDQLTTIRECSKIREKEVESITMKLYSEEQKLRSQMDVLNKLTMKLKLQKNHLITEREYLSKLTKSNRDKYRELQEKTLHFDCNAFKLDNQEKVLKRKNQLLQKQREKIEKMAYLITKTELDTANLFEFRQNLAKYETYLTQKYKTFKGYEMEKDENSNYNLQEETVFEEYLRLKEMEIKEQETSNEEINKSLPMSNTTTDVFSQNSLINSKGYYSNSSTSLLFSRERRENLISKNSILPSKYESPIALMGRNINSSRVLVSQQRICSNLERVKTLSMRNSQMSNESQDELISLKSQKGSADFFCHSGSSLGLVGNSPTSINLMAQVTKISNVSQDDQRKNIEIQCDNEKDAESSASDQNSEENKGDEEEELERIYTEEEEEESSSTVGSYIEEDLEENEIDADGEEEEVSENGVYSEEIEEVLEDQIKESENANEIQEREDSPIKSEIDETFESAEKLNNENSNTIQKEKIVFFEPDSEEEEAEEEIEEIFSAEDIVSHISICSTNANTNVTNSKASFKAAAELVVKISESLQKPLSPEKAQLNLSEKGSLNSSSRKQTPIIQNKIISISSFDFSYTSTSNNDQTQSENEFENDDDGKKESVFSFSPVKEKVDNTEIVQLKIQSEEKPINQSKENECPSLITTNTSPSVKQSPRSLVGAIKNIGIELQARKLALNEEFLKNRTHVESKIYSNNFSRFNSNFARPLMSSSPMDNSIFSRQYIMPNNSTFAHMLINGPKKDTANNNVKPVEVTLQVKKSSPQKSPVKTEKLAGEGAPPKFLKELKEKIEVRKENTQPQIQPMMFQNTNKENDNEYRNQLGYVCRPPKNISITSKMENANANGEPPKNIGNLKFYPSEMASVSTSSRRKDEVSGRNNETSSSGSGSSKSQGNVKGLPKHLKFGTFTTGTSDKNSNGKKKRTKRRKKQRAEEGGNNFDQNEELGEIEYNDRTIKTKMMGNYWNAEKKPIYDQNGNYM